MSLEIQPNTSSDHQKAPQSRSSRRKAMLICKHKLGFCCLHNFSFQKKNIYFLLTVYTISLYDCFSPIWLLYLYVGEAFSAFIILEPHWASWISGLQFSSNSQVFPLWCFQIFFLHPLPPWNSVTSVLYCLVHSSRSLSLLISFSVSCCPMPQFGWLTLQCLRCFIMPSSIFC